MIKPYWSVKMKTERLLTKIVTVNTIFSFQAKLLFSDGEKVIPRLTHELPGIKVRITVLGLKRGTMIRLGGRGILCSTHL